MNYTLNVDRLASGIYNYTIMVWDAEGGYDRDTVWVSVVEDSSTIISTTNLTNTTLIIAEIPEWVEMFSLVISIGSVVIIVVVVVIIYRSRSVSEY